MAKQKVYIGTELKLNISIEKMGSLSMSSYDFDIVLAAGNAKRQSLTLSKKGDVLSSGLKRVDDDNYIVAFDTKELGMGRLTVQITAYIPDGDFQDGKRTEIDRIDTGIDIVNNI